MASFQVGGIITEYHFEVLAGAFCLSVFVLNAEDLLLLVCRYTFALKGLPRGQLKRRRAGRFPDSGSIRTNYSWQSRSRSTRWRCRGGAAAAEEVELGSRTWCVEHVPDGPALLRAACQRILPRRRRRRRQQRICCFRV